MSLFTQLRFFPASLILRFKIAVARSLLRGEHHWHALDELQIPGHGLDLLRLDFPPSTDAHPVWGYGRPVHPELETILKTGKETQLERLRSCLRAAEPCRTWPENENSAEVSLPWRQNQFLTPLDQAALFGMLCLVQPEKYLEIGSGMSTRVAWQARRTSGSAMQIISVDPEPRLAIAALCDKVYQNRLEDMTDKFLELVTPRTVIFFDGSHRSFPGSDVTVFFLSILPRLPTGTIVHVHDIYIPSDYPAALFRCYWSEQYILAAYLLGGAHRLKVILPCAYLSTLPEAEVTLQTAFGPGVHGGSSFWMEIT
jgi:hypothetical protein